MDNIQENPDQDNQSLIISDASYQQSLAFQNEQTNQTPNDDAPVINPPGNQVYQSFPFQGGQSQPIFQGQYAPQQMNYEQQTAQYMGHNPMVSNSVPGFDGVSTMPEQITARFPQRFFCQNCRKIHVSENRHVIGKGTMIIAGVLCLCGGILCAPIPFVVDTCQDTLHICPECKQQVGRVDFCNL